jgi:putative oxidoreductase
MKTPGRTLVRAAGRLLTGTAFVVLGADAARKPGARVEQAGPTLDAIRSVVPLPENDELLVRANGAVQAAGGALLALGRFPRLSSVVIAGSMVPTTLAGHAFWKVEDPAARKGQKVQFIKNAALVGGLLLNVALDQPKNKDKKRKK